MKVLMMHRSDSVWGGAMVQMDRLRSGFRKQGIDAKVLCREGSDEAVLMPYRPYVERWARWITGRVGLNDIHLASSFRVTALQAFKEADVIDLHCLHSGTFSYAALPRLTSGKPVVFTFHDMWPLTGHCHASLECERWKTGCGKCPHPDVHPAIRRDATAIEWRLKKWAYGRSKFTIVTPSAWLRDRVRQSLLGGFPVHHIPHGVDLDEFKPLGREHCRALLGIPEGKTVLVCAINDMDRPLKGAELLASALGKLPDSMVRECVLLFFGRSNKAILNRIPIPVVDLGYLSSDRIKAIAYSAADLLVNPTRAESFGLVALEAIACGTPVVAYGVGGIPELVRPGITGLLATPDDSQSLTDRIIEALLDRPRLESMRLECRRVAIAEYSLDLQVQRYVELYQRVIAGGD